MLPINPSRFANAAAMAPSGGGSFTPASLSPFIWIDPSDISSLFQSNAGSTAVAADGDPVGYASDKSGNAFHLNSNADDTTRPTYKDVSSIKYIDFDGSNDALKRLANAGIYNAGAASIFMAVKANSVAVNKMMLCEGGSGGNPIAGWVRSDSSTATNVMTFMRDDSATSILQNSWGSSNGGLDNTWRVIGFTWDGTTLSPYVNGNAVSNRACAAGSSLTSDRFSIGCQYRGSDGLTNFAPMSLAGLVVVKSDIGSGNKASLVTWLGAKVGLSL